MVERRNLSTIEQFTPSLVGKAGNSPDAFITMNTGLDDHWWRTLAAGL